MLSKLMIYQEWHFFLPLLFNILPCYFVIAFYGVCTSKMAFRLGDCTPKLNGGTSLHPLTQVEPVGFLLFVTTGLGWGAWFPLEPNNFKKPQRDSWTLFVLGTLSGILFSVFSLICAALLYHLNVNTPWILCFILFFCDLSVLALSFSLFQWIPLPYFGAFRCASSFFSPKLTEKVLKYHKHISLILVIVLWSGLLHSTLTGLIAPILLPLCQLLNLPTWLLTHYFL